MTTTREPVPAPRAPRLAWAAPCALAFAASAGVMAVEMAAGRMMSRQVGSSLYTWTSVIGVVLAGIVLGNFLGGRLADRFEARRTIGTLFALAAAATALIPLVDRAAGAWSRFDGMDMSWSWPSRILVHTAATFGLPAALAGLLGPVIAKRALDLRLGTGRTLGNVYAWGALGSIVGTFAAGFFLIAALGTAGVLHAVAATFAALGLLVAPRHALSVVVVAWPLVVAGVRVDLAPAPKGVQGWALSGGRLSLQETRFPETIHATESQYSSVRVTEETVPGAGDAPIRLRRLFLDNLLHSVWSPDEPLRLEYDYERIYAAVTERFGRKRDDLRTLFLGGGGYVFPRYVRAKWPRSTVVVAEIDPAVTEANFAAFGLRRDEVRIVEGASPSPGAVEIRHLDARNHVDELLAEKRRNPDFQPFDFIYGDAFNDFTVPYHLVTKEFALKLKELLRPETGLYLVNVIDIYSEGRFLGALERTLATVFPSVHVLTVQPDGPVEGPTARDTFILVGALRRTDLKDLGIREGEDRRAGTELDERQMWHLRTRAGGVVLTDDYSPVENLLRVVVRRRGVTDAAGAGGVGTDASR